LGEEKCHSSKWLKFERRKKEMGFAWRWINLKAEDANSNGDEEKEITP
jgi:hypothetical protein